MSVLDKIISENQTKKGKKAEFMLLIGEDSYIPDLDRYEFVSLPQSLGLDTMNKAEIKGTGEFQTILCSRNDLLDELLEGAQAKLQPGESRELNLKVRLYRRQASEEATHKKVTFNFWKED